MSAQDTQAPAARFPALPKPVTIEIVQDHPYKSKGKGTRGCAVCGGSQLATQHLGAPKSLNFYLSSDPKVYYGHKKAWTALMIAKLEETGLPRGLESVKAAGSVCFAQNRKRDEGNFTYFLQKILGDALVEGEWLPDDVWYRYEFGRLHPKVVTGLSSCSLTITPQIWDVE